MFIGSLFLAVIAGKAQPGYGNNVNESTDFSYVYIQGDKIVPFYVKLEGKMLPRYGKDYCIISELGPGPINIEILFQLNEYPAQKFTIDVPEKGSRGFLLDKQGSGYALYDLQSKKYLPPNKNEK